MCDYSMVPWKLNPKSPPDIVPHYKGGFVWKFSMFSFFNIVELNLFILDRLLLHSVLKIKDGVHRLFWPENNRGIDLFELWF